jgi:hypothetical protein
MGFARITSSTMLKELDTKVHHQEFHHSPRPQGRKVARLKSSTRSARQVLDLTLGMSLSSSCAIHGELCASARRDSGRSKSARKAPYQDSTHDMLGGTLPPMPEPCPRGTEVGISPLPTQYERLQWELQEKTASSRQLGGRRRKALRWSLH